MSFRSQKKSVSFYPRVVVQDVLHFHDYSTTEKAACWYSKEEKKLILAEKKKTIRLMRMLPEACKVESDVICTRGLEDADTRNLARDVAMEAVLDEQDLQVVRDVYSPEKIAEIYSARSRSSVVEARLIGRADERWVQKQQEPVKQISPMKLSIDEHDARSAFILRPNRSSSRLFLSPAA